MNKPRKWGYCLRSFVNLKNYQKKLVQENCIQAYQTRRQFNSKSYHDFLFKNKICLKIRATRNLHFLNRVLVPVACTRRVLKYFSINYGRKILQQILFLNIAMQIIHLLFNVENNNRNQKTASWALVSIFTKKCYLTYIRRKIFL